MSHFDGAAQLIGVRQPYLEAWTLLTDLHQKKDCANPRCGEIFSIASRVQGLISTSQPLQYTVTSPRAQRFPKCAQCRIPSYCKYYTTYALYMLMYKRGYTGSRECQIEAWAFPEYPHKVVCKAWSILMKYWPTGFNLKEDRKPAVFPPFLNAAQKDAWSNPWKQQRISS